MRNAQQVGFAADEISQIMQSIWASVFGVVLERAQTPAGALHWGGPTVTGCVQITGRWEGAVTIRCSMSLARKAAALMFGAEQDAVTPEEVRDALGELVNMTGGNFKNLLPGPCQLSLPAVTEGSDYLVSIPRSKLLDQVTFSCEGQALLVSLLEKDPSGR